MLLGQLALDAILASEDPVHGVVEFVLGGVFDAHLLPEGVGERLVLQGAGGGQLGSGIEDSGDDHGHGERPLAGGTRREQLLDAEPAGGSEDGGHVTVGPGAFDGESVAEGGERDAALEEDAESVDDFVWATLLGTRSMYMDTKLMDNGCVVNMLTVPLHGYAFCP